MTRNLDNARGRKRIDETITSSETAPLATQSRRLQYGQAPQAFTGVDAGFVAVPATTISAKMQSSGSATLGAGTAYVYKVGFAGLLEPVLDVNTGQHLVHSVFNLTTDVFAPSGTSNPIEEDTPLLNIDQLRDGRYLVSPFGEQTLTPVRLLRAFANATITAPGSGPISIMENEITCTVSQANPAVVTTGSPHGYTTGNTVRIFPDYSLDLTTGMIELSSWNDYSITVTSTTTFTIPENTSSFQAWTSGRCARTNPGTAIARFAAYGIRYGQHTELFVQPRVEDSSFDIVHAHFHGVQNLRTEETIQRFSEGNAELIDQGVKIILRTHNLLPAGTAIQSSGNCQGFYYRTSPPDEPGGIAGRPYIFQVSNVNCDDIIAGS